MILWQVTNCRAAVDTELQVRRAVAMLRARYGWRWRRRGPSDLVWMLRMGVGLEEACARVRATVGSERADPTATPNAPTSVHDHDATAS
jgi:hypothetical protein